MQGFGFSVLSLHSLILEHRHPKLAILEVEGFPIYQQWYAVSLQNKVPSIIAETFLQHLLTESKNYDTYETLNTVENAIELLFRRKNRIA